MTKTDALLSAKNNICVNSVHPGFIWIRLVEAYLKKQGDDNSKFVTGAELVN